MGSNLRGQKKGIAILSALFLLVFLVIFAEVIWSQYISSSLLQRRYENSLQVIYDLEAARAAALWEEKYATPEMSWDTTSNPPSTCRLENATITGKFYRLTGFNFRLQAINTVGGITLYAQAFKGSEANPQSSEYLEYFYAVTSPLYQYVMFKNSDLIFPQPGYDPLLLCYGGKIHTNGDIIFNNNFIRFDQVKEISSAGTMTYSGSQYPAPNIIDKLDGTVNGMAPAPYVGSTYHYYVTTGAVINPGPYRIDASQWKQNANWLGDAWSYNAPLLWRGEETRFQGRQYIDRGTKYYLQIDGTYTSNAGAPNLATINRYYLSGNSLMTTESAGSQDYLPGDVYFRPYKDSQGGLNDKWFEIPGALPQTYSWDKYTGTLGSETPVTFYATEKCSAGSAACKTSEGGWRYIKKLGSTICPNDACYNNPGAQYVKAQNYNYGPKPYYSYITPNSWDKNDQFFNDAYRYGNDWNNPNSPYRQIMAFDAAKQPTGYQEYLNLLSQKNMDEVLKPNNERKVMNLEVFDDAGGESPYKTMAQKSGLYIDGGDVNTVIGQLGSNVARIVTFKNWQTNKDITLLEINVGEMINQGKTPANGIIYAKDIPIRLSNATDLPGTNSADGRKAVFTVISEESVYLKGDYNTVDWKVSNIATKKKVYTLSNNFNDPNTLLDLAIYKDYPYVYVKKNPADPGVYLPQEGNPNLNNGTWLIGNELGLSNPIKTFINNRRAQKQTQYAGSGIKPPNAVDKDYTYQSLFITPYAIDDTLEKWYIGNTQANKSIIGSVLDLYDANDPDYQNYRANLDVEERDDAYANVFTRGRLAPSTGYYIVYYGSRVWSGGAPLRTLGYDPRFPQTTTNNAQATFSVTGTGAMNVNIWRLVNKNYFDSHIVLP